MDEPFDDAEIGANSRRRWSSWWEWMSGQCVHFCVKMTKSVFNGDENDQISEDSRFGHLFLFVLVDFPMKNYFVNLLVLFLIIQIFI